MQKQKVVENKKSTAKKPKHVEKVTQKSIASKQASNTKNRNNQVESGNESAARKACAATVPQTAKRNRKRPRAYLP